MLHIPTSNWCSNLVSISIELISLSLLSVESSLVLVSQVSVDGTSVVSDLVVEILVFDSSEIISVLDIVRDVVDLISVLSFHILLDSIRIISSLHLIQLSLHLLLRHISRSDIARLPRPLWKPLFDLLQLPLRDSLGELLNLSPYLSVDLFYLLCFSLFQHIDLLRRAVGCSLRHNPIDLIISPLSDPEDLDFKRPLHHLSSLIKETAFVDVGLVVLHLLEPILIIIPLPVDQPVLPPLNLGQPFDDIIFEP